MTNPRCRPAFPHRARSSRNCLSSDAAYAAAAIASLLSVVLLMTGCLPGRDTTGTDGGDGTDLHDTRVVFEIQGDLNSSEFGATHMERYRAIGEFNVEMPEDQSMIEGYTGTGFARGSRSSSYNTSSLQQTGSADLETNYDVRSYYSENKRVGFAMRHLNPSTYMEHTVNRWTDGTTTESDIPRNIFWTFGLGFTFDFVDNAVVYDTIFWTGGAKMFRKARFFRIGQGSFDFDVDLDTHRESIQAGQAVDVIVSVKYLRGPKSDVTLTVTDFSSKNIATTFSAGSVMPTGSATLEILISPQTPADGYLFTVRGEAQGTFLTSVDAVRVDVQ